MSSEAPATRAELVEHRLNPSDIEKYIAFDDENYFQSETPTDHEPPHWDPEDIQKAMDQGDIFSAFTDPAGQWAATAWFEPRAKEGELYVANLVIAPEYRDQGIGSGMLQKAEATARELGLGKCILAVDPLNSRGLYLYLRQGYQITEYMADDPDGLDDWVHMERVLDGNPELDTANATEAQTGDDAKLKELLEAGYRGYALKIDPDKDPRRNVVAFAKSLAG